MESRRWPEVKKVSSLRLCACHCDHRDDAAHSRGPLLGRRGAQEEIVQQDTGPSFISHPPRPRLDDGPSARFDEGFGRVLGSSPELRRLQPLCMRLAESDLPVVISGETGTGKELLAESLHELGPRASQPFVVLDCTSIPKNLVESALFGHERGAFTGATQARRGVFEEAHGGTLLLDEIGDLEFDLQAKLLRALERREIKRVGSTRRIHVDVRIMAATRRNLAEMVRARAVP